MHLREFFGVEKHSGNIRDDQSILGSGPSALYLAVIVQAIRDLNGSGEAYYRKANMADARWWIFAAKDFTRLCHTLNIEPEYVREIATGILTKEKPAKRTSRRRHAVVQVDVEVETWEATCQNN